MKDDRKTEIKVGLTVLAGVIIFIWIFGWAKNFSLQSNDQIIKVKFNNVSGLEIGDPVTVNGLRKGYVKEMIVGSNSVMVELSVEKNISLSKDATFAITMLDLMGGKKVEILPGNSTEKLNVDIPATGVFYADIPQAMSLLGSMQDDFVSVLKDVKISLTSLNSYLTDKKLNNDVKESLSNLNSLTKKLDMMLSENRSDLKTLTKNAVELTEKTNELVSDNKENINRLFGDLKSILNKTDNLLTDLNTLAKETKDQQNNIGKVLYDENLYKDLKTTIKQINELTSILIDQLKNDGINVDANIF